MTSTTKNDRTVDKTGPSVRGDRHKRRIVFGLTGLLGVVWAAVIATRYAGMLPS